MVRTLALLATAAAIALGAGSIQAQDTKAPAKKPAAAQSAPAKAPAKKSAAAQSSPKAGAGEKVCRHKFPSGEKRSWVCKKEEPCCAWDEINYVKCGSTITGCL